VTPAALALVAVLAQARDAAPAASGSGSISGRITTDETPPRPMRRATVTLNTPDIRIVGGRTAITDDAGRFAFAGLAPGRYTMTASKRGWVTTPFGTKTPGRGGRSIPLTDGEKVTASIALPRTAVITGTITDATGGMPAGATLRVLRYTYTFNTGERRLTPAGATTIGPDERGQYRIFGLTPGEYYVAVVGNGGPFSAGSDLHLTTDVDVQEAMKAVEGGPSAPIVDVPQRGIVVNPTYYPGTTSPAQATPITVRAGEERGGVDFTVQYSGAVRIDGTVAGLGGGPPPAGTTQVNLAVNDPSTPALGFESFRNARPGADGRFEFAQVAPGPYLLIARTVLPPAEGSTSPQVYAASMDLDVQTDDQHGLTLTLEDTFAVSGLVRFEGDGAAPSLRGSRVTLQPATQSGTVTVSSGGAQVNADGTFTVPGITPGRYRLVVGLPGPQVSWTVKSATLGGRDALDGVVDVRQPIADAAITITDRLADLGGRVDGPGGADYTLVLFAQDNTYWASPSRRIMTARTAKDGTFTFRRVPPGDYALAAVDDVEPGEWYDPAFLQRLAPSAIKVTIGEGEKKTQDIRIGGG